MTPPLFRDSAGVILERGQEVAFNRSGDVVRGVIDLVGKTGICHIRPLPPHGTWMSSSSKVRNPRSILVLKEAP